MKKECVISCNTTYKVGDTVKLPFESEGVIKRINNATLDWFKYKVKITIASCMYTVGEIESFKSEQLNAYNKCKE